MMRHLLFLSLLIHLTLAENPSPKQTWQTLNGKRPVVIARGGFSGLFPDSSRLAFEFGKSVSLKDTILYCDLQLTKDHVGFCQTEIRLDNSTSAPLVFPQGQKTYNIDGKNVRSWFSVDFPALDFLPNTTLVQSILTRPSAFDGQQIMMVEDVIQLTLPPPPLWVNVQYDTFYHQHGVSALSCFEELRFEGINYISSPEIGFLKSIKAKAPRSIKLVFKFQQLDAIEPTTKQPYSAILANLTAIKEFASAVLVPKQYIWPVKDMYLQPATTVVNDAHKAGMEIYAYGFANDIPGAYNYSYDPSAEYLQYIDNDIFSVDGFLTDFPPTASEAIACLAHNKNASKPVKPKALIISHNGASGDFPGCTDLAYEKAVADGADIIDCSVQVSKDGVAFCLDKADLTSGTNALTMFMSRSSSIPEIQEKNGIFSFDLMWSEIQTLKPQLVSSLPQGGLPRSPANKDKGKLITLAEFLEIAKVKKVSGVMLNIRNAAYLASKKGINVKDAVNKALSNATLDKQAMQQIMISSEDTSVLEKFKEFPNYKRVLYIEDIISDAPKKSVDEVKKYADAVDLRKPSVIKTNAFFVTNFTNVVEEMHAANISVHVSVIYNEYTTLAFDYFSDPIVEITALVEGANVDALVTEYPATAAAYMKSPCSDPRVKVDYPITLIPPGELLNLVPEGALPPATAPAPSLDTIDLVDPPLPSVSNAEATSPQTGPSTDSKMHRSSGHADVASLILPFSAAVLALVFLSAVV